MIYKDIPAGKPGHNLGEGERALSAVAVSLLLVVLAIVVIAVARPRSIEGRL